MHKTIKRFGMEGTMGDDADFARIRSMYEQLVVQQMRDHGYVPVLDLGPYWSTEYDEKKDQYAFVISAYGVHVGKKRSWEVEGIVNGRELMRPIPPSKSKPSSESAE